MAGTKEKDKFKELISPFLKSKMSKAEKELGKNSSDYIALEKQYVINSLENKIDGNLENQGIIGLEFLAFMIINLWSV